MDRVTEIDREAERARDLRARGTERGSGQSERAPGRETESGCRERARQADREIEADRGSPERGRESEWQLAVGESVIKC
jgi:hypothetical protein